MSKLMSRDVGLLSATLQNVAMALRMHLVIKLLKLATEKVNDHFQISTLLHIKNHLSATMRQDRLDDLAVIESDFLRTLMTQHLIDDSAHEKSRQLIF